MFYAINYNVFSLTAQMFLRLSAVLQMPVSKKCSSKFPFSHTSPLFKVTGHKIHTELKFHSEHAVKRQLLARTLDSSMIDHRSAVGAAFLTRNHFKYSRGAFEDDN